MIKVRATGKAQFTQELWQCIGLFQGINQQRLFPIAQELQVDAQAFF